MKNILLAFASFAMLAPAIYAQNTEAIVAQIQKEATENSQLETMAHELMDVIGPRLVGTPQMNKAHDWAVERFSQWGIQAENEQWGTMLSSRPLRKGMPRYFFSQSSCLSSSGAP